METAASAVVSRPQGSNSRSSQTEDHLGPVAKSLEQCISVIKSSVEFRELSYRVGQSCRGDLTLTVTRDNLSGLLGATFDPVTLTVTSRGLCYFSALFTPVRVTDLHLQDSDDLDLQSFRQMLWKLNGRAGHGFCPGFTENDFPQGMDLETQGLQVIRQPCCRVQSSACPVFYQQRPSSPCPGSQPLDVKLCASCMKTLTDLYLSLQGKGLDVSLSVFNHLLPLPGSPVCPSYKSPPPHFIKSETALGPSESACSPVTSVPDASSVNADNKVLNMKYARGSIYSQHTCESLTLSHESLKRVHMDRELFPKAEEAGPPSPNNSKVSITTTTVSSSQTRSVVVSSPLSVPSSFCPWPTTSTSMATSTGHDRSLMQFSEECPVSQPVLSAPVTAITDQTRLTCDWWTERGDGRGSAERVDTPDWSPGQLVIDEDADPDQLTTASDEPDLKRSCYRCPVCQEAFTSNSALQHHSVQQHPSDDHGTKDSTHHVSPTPFTMMMDSVPRGEQAPWRKCRRNSSVCARVLSKNGDQHKPLTDNIISNCQQDKPLTDARANQTRSCQRCGETFALNNNNNLLLHHQGRSGGSKLIVCTNCGAKFTNKKKFAAHLKKHTWSLPYLCTACSKLNSPPKMPVGQHRTGQGLPAWLGRKQRTAKVIVNKAKKCLEETAHVRSVRNATETSSSLSDSSMCEIEQSEQNNVTCNRQDLRSSFNSEVDSVSSSGHQSLQTLDQTNDNHTELSARFVVHDHTCVKRDVEKSPNFNHSRLQEPASLSQTLNADGKRPSVSSDTSLTRPSPLTESRERVSPDIARGVNTDPRPVGEQGERSSYNIIPSNTLPQADSAVSQGIPGQKHDSHNRRQSQSVSNPAVDTLLQASGSTPPDSASLPPPAANTDQQSSNSDDHQKSVSVKVQRAQQKDKDETEKEQKMKQDKEQTVKQDREQQKDKEETDKEQTVEEDREQTAQQKDREQTVDKDREQTHGPTDREGKDLSTREQELEQKERELKERELVLNRQTQFFRQMFSGRQHTPTSVAGSGGASVGDASTLQHAMAVCSALSRVNGIKYNNHKGPAFRPIVPKPTASSVNTSLPLSNKGQVQGLTDQRQKQTMEAAAVSGTEGKTTGTQLKGSSTLSVGSGPVTSTEPQTSPSSSTHTTLTGFTALSPNSVCSTTSTDNYSPSPCSSVSSPQPYRPQDPRHTEPSSQTKKHEGNFLLEVMRLAHKMPASARQFLPSTDTKPFSSLLSQSSAAPVAKMSQAFPQTPGSKLPGSKPSGLNVPKTSMDKRHSTLTRRGQKESCYLSGGTMQEKSSLPVVRVPPHEINRLLALSENRHTLRGHTAQSPLTWPCLSPRPSPSSSVTFTSDVPTRTAQTRDAAPPLLSVPQCSSGHVTNRTSPLTAQSPNNVSTNLRPIPGLLRVSAIKNDTSDTRPNVHGPDLIEDTGPLDLTTSKTNKTSSLVSLDHKHGAGECRTVQNRSDSQANQTLIFQPFHLSEPEAPKDLSQRSSLLNHKTGETHPHPSTFGSASKNKVPKLRHKERKQRQHDSLQIPTRTAMATDASSSSEGRSRVKSPQHRVRCSPQPQPCSPQCGAVCPDADVSNHKLADCKVRVASPSSHSAQNGMLLWKPYDNSHPAQLSPVQSHYLSSSEGYALSLCAQSSLPTSSPVTSLAVPSSLSSLHTANRLSPDNGSDRSAPSNGHMYAADPLSSGERSVRRPRCPSVPDQTWPVTTTPSDDAYTTTPLPSGQSLTSPLPCGSLSAGSPWPDFTCGRPLMTLVPMTYASLMTDVSKIRNSMSPGNVSVSSPSMPGCVPPQPSVVTPVDPRQWTPHVNAMPGQGMMMCHQSDTPQSSLTGQREGYPSHSSSSTPRRLSVSSEHGEQMGEGVRTDWLQEQSQRQQQLLHILRQKLRQQQETQHRHEHKH